MADSQWFRWMNTEFLQTNRDYLLHLQHISIILTSAAAVLFYKETKIIKPDLYQVAFSFTLVAFVFFLVVLSLRLYLPAVASLISATLLTALLYKNDQINFERSSSSFSLLPLFAFLAGVISLIIGLNAYGQMQTIILKSCMTEMPDLNSINPLIIWQVCFEIVTLMILVLWGLWYKLFSGK